MKQLIVPEPGDIVELLVSPYCKGKILTTYETRSDREVLMPECEVRSFLPHRGIVTTALDFVRVIRKAEEVEMDREYFSSVSEFFA